MFGGIQGNTEKIFTVLMTCFTTHVSLGSSLPMGNGNTCLNSWQQGFRVPCPRGPVSSWCLITLSHAPLSLCTYGPPTPCACCWAWDHIGSAVCPSHYSPPKRVRLQCSVNFVFFLLLLNVELRGRRAQRLTELPVHPVPCAPSVAHWPDSSGGQYVPTLLSSRNVSAMLRPQRLPPWVWLLEAFSQQREGGCLLIPLC